MEPTLQSLQEENQRLRRAVEELAILNELARVIGVQTNSEEVMQIIIRRSLRAVKGEQGVITLIDQNEPGTMKTLVRTTASSSDHTRFHIHESMLGWMQLHKKPLLLNDPVNDDRFRGVNWDGAIRNALSVPLMTKSAMTGMLTVYNKSGGEKFADDDQRLLAIIAAQSAQVIENARLFEKEKQLLQIQSEMRLAAEIQLGLLPKTAPEIAGYSIVGTSIPAQSVGGDYYDFIRIDERRLALCLGDVSGKGMPAALLMANLQATLRGQTIVSASARECVSRANRLLVESTSSDKYATLFYGILDLSEHTFQYTNAAHNPPVHLRTDGSSTFLKKGGIMLGMLTDIAFETDTVTLAPGDLLVIYSDGITEAFNAADEDFGEERLMEILIRHRESPVGRLMEEILSQVRVFMGNAPQSDDMSLLMVRRDAA
jgi:sigma-B regulation protein RsbU (phosphoserine phosphatase)